MSLYVVVSVFRKDLQEIWRDQGRSEFVPACILIKNPNLWHHFKGSCRAILLLSSSHEHTFTCDSDLRTTAKCLNEQFFCFHDHLCFFFFGISDFYSVKRGQETGLRDKRGEYKQQRFETSFGGNAFTGGSPDQTTEQLTVMHFKRNPSSISDVIFWGLMKCLWRGEGVESVS